MISIRSSTALAKRYWAGSPHGSKIQLCLAPALETLADLTGPFDLIFIDADKANYVKYFRRALDLIAPTGVILIDNVLWRSVKKSSTRFQYRSDAGTKSSGICRTSSLSGAAHDSRWGLFD